MAVKDELHRAQKLPADTCFIPTILKNNFFKKSLPRMKLSDILEVYL